MQTMVMYSTAELSAEFGLSHVALHRWAEAEPETLGPSVRSSGIGSRREWSAHDRARIAKAVCFRSAVAGLMVGDTQGASVHAMARFVREAVENSVGDWVWECDDFTLIVAGSSEPIDELAAG